METEGLVERFVVYEYREEGEDVEEVNLLEMLQVFLQSLSFLLTCDMPNSLVVCPRLQ